MTETSISFDETSVVALQRPSAGAGGGGGNIGDGGDDRGGGGGGGDYWSAFIRREFEHVYSRLERHLVRQNEFHQSSIKEVFEFIREFASDAKDEATFAKAVADSFVRLTEQNRVLAERVAALERDLAALLPSDAP